MTAPSGPPRSHLWVTAIVAGLSLVAAACGGGPSPQPDSTPGTLPSRPAGAGPSGLSPPFATDASLALGLSGQPSNWNPLAAPATADPALAAVVDAVLPSAFLTGPDLSATRNDELVTSTTKEPATSDAPQTVVYDLNARATWSDGVPITGADFVYTWQAQSGQSRFHDAGGKDFTPASTAAYGEVASVTSGARDPDQVVVRFATPDPDWESLFDPILPAHVARAVGFDHGFTDPVTSLVSGGAFEVQAYQPGRDVVLVRNPRWWGPAANLSTVDILFVDSATEATESLEQGQLDAAVTSFTPATVAPLRANGALTVSVTNGTTFDDLVFNERSGPLAVRAVRLALMLAVDRQSLAQGAAASGDTAAVPVRNRAFPIGSTGYRDETAVLGNVATADPARAEQLLAAAGYARSGPSLTRHGRDVHLTLAVATTSPLAGSEAAAVVAAGRTLGIAVTIRGTSLSPVREPAAGLDVAMAIVEAPLTASPSGLAGTYGSGGAGNRSGYSSTVMDGLLARLAAAGSSAELHEIADQVDAQAWDDAVDLPLLGVPRVLAFQSRYIDLIAAPSTSGIDDDMVRWGIAESA